MDWNDVRLFLEIVRTGSFNGAATVLGTSKPTVSRRVAALEQIAGARLFLRHPTGAEMTPAGVELLQRALKIDEEMKAFERALRGLGQRENRVVSIEASEGVSSYLLTPLIAKQRLGPLGLVAPQVGVELPLIRLVPMGTQEVADIRIVWSAPEDLPVGRSTDQVRKLASIRFAPFGSDAFLKAAAEEPTTFDQLVRHPLVTLHDYQWFKSEQSFAAWGDLISRNERQVIPVARTAMLGHLTAQGSGVSLLPTYSTLYSDLIHQLGITSPSMVADLWIVAGEDILKDPKVRKCYSAIVRIFSAYEW